MINQQYQPKNLHQSELEPMPKKEPPVEPEASFSYSVILPKYVGEYNKQHGEIITRFGIVKKLNTARIFQVAGRKTASSGYVLIRSRTASCIPLLDIGIHNGIYRGQNYGR